MPDSRIVISMGDPLGVGPEIICKALNNREQISGAQYLIIGSPYYFEKAYNLCGCKFEYKISSSPEFGSIPCVYSPLEWQGEFPPVGNWTPQSGWQSLEYFKTAVELCLKSAAQAVVTCPICKAAWKAAGGTWPGHTELLAELTGSDNEVMMLAGGGLRVALATIHEPIHKVPKLLTTAKIIKTARIILADLQTRLKISKPRLAILGLNPHAGEEGTIGIEEQDVIIPAIEQLQDDGHSVIGPLPADTAFHKMLSGEYDAVLAMYHDQGLGPLKTVAFDSGVNITLGLPVVRTSVDHGTAFDIAGTGQATESSLIEAIKYAILMSS